MKPSIKLVGGGLVGSLLSILLAKRGYNVEVFEARPDMRTSSGYAGKSINLALSHRGWKAIDMAGIRPEIEKVAIPMYGRMIHDVQGNQSFQPYNTEGDAIYSVSRGGLNIELMNLAESVGVKFHFSHRCTAMDLDKKVFTTTDANGNSSTHTGDIIIGTDGAASEIRYSMQRRGRFQYSQHFIEHGYKELEITPGPNGEFKLDKNSLHIWPRGNFMMIGLPNPEGNFTMTLFFPFEGKPSFDSVQTDEEIEKFFNDVFPNAVPLMPAYKEDYKNNPNAMLGIVRCEPWNYGNDVLLLGDAAHAIVPFYGQGMNCGFEDCTELMRLLDEHNDNWDVVVPEIARIRKPNADAIADLALYNFIEMRDKTADPRFVLQKKMEGEIHKRHPQLWTPLYSMVSFSHTPYAEAWKMGQAQDAFMQEFLDIQGIEEKWNTPEIISKIDEKLLTKGIFG